MHLLLSFYFLIIRPPPSSTLFPYTTLFRSRPPTPMTRHRIAQIGENRNPKSPENRPQTRRFLQIRLLQLRRSATPFNGLAVLHGRLNTDPNFPKPSGPRLLEDFRVMLSTRRVSAI